MSKLIDKYLFHIVFNYRRYHNLPDVPLRILPGLDVEVVHVDPVVILLRLSPLHVQTVVTRAGQVGD